MNMKALSITQEFLLCSLSEKGKLPVIGKEVSVCLLASGLIELLLNNCIQVDEKNTVNVIGDLDEKQGYLKSLFNRLSESGPVKIEKIAQEYCLGLTEKRLNMLIIDIGKSLEGLGCVTSEKSFFFKSKLRFVPNTDEVDKVIQKIRAELLENGPISDETVALVSLLEKSKQIKQYFSSYEAKQLKSRLKEIREAPTNQLIKQMVDYVDSLVTIITVTAATS